MKHFVWFAAIATLVIAALVLGYVAGFQGGAYSERRQRESEEFDTISGVLASDPAYEGVVITACDGSHRLAGELPDAATRDRLQSDMRRLFGDGKADREITEVRVKQ